MATSRRLWDKGQAVDALIHAFTVGDDPVLDRRLVHFDVLGSIAHTLTLNKAGLLSDADCAALCGGLREVAALDRAGKFEIPAELEDCHTAIEAYLTRKLGEAGGRIHTGRSRNDQVATAMRLYLRAAALELGRALQEFAAALLARVERDGRTPMPGFTHMQPAMPSSVGLWLHAYAEWCAELAFNVADVLRRLDACPLGTGAGFGVPLPLDREYTAGLLGFSRAQANPIDVQNSRGRLELAFVRVGVEVAALLEKFASDLMHFTQPQFGFFSLPEALTTGSSIMPQKRNPDVLELLRARCGKLRGRQHELEWVIGKLPSSYHRDLQLTKGPALEAADDLGVLLPVGVRVVETLEVRADRLTAAMSPELYATQAAYERVRKGVPFRQAYREVAEELRSGRFVMPPADAANDPTVVTAAQIAATRGRLAEAEQMSATHAERARRAEELLKPA